MNTAKPQGKKRRRAARTAAALMGVLAVTPMATGPWGGRAAAEGPSPRPVAPASLVWKRSYKLGETLTYEMTGSNQGWQYQIRATDRVRQDGAGGLYEEVGWSDLKSNAPMTLSPASLALRQSLSLDGTGRHMALPDMSQVQPPLVGPITDMLTFYSDLLLARHHNLTRAGQHVFVKHGTPNVWADGQRFLLAEDAIDFDFTLLGIDPRAHTATLLARHVPPLRPQVRLPAGWMRTPVADTPNNWVQVERVGGKYSAQVGKETFDIRLVLDTRDGKLLSATEDNTITIVSRVCDDAALSVCGTPSPQTIHRVVRLNLAPDAVRLPSGGAP